MACILDCDVAIGLDRDGLVVFRGEGKAHLHHIALAEPIKRTAFPSELWVSRAARSIGLRDRPPNALR